MLPECNFNEGKPKLTVILQVFKEKWKNYLEKYSDYLKFCQYVLQDIAAFVVNVYTGGQVTSTEESRSHSDVTQITIKFSSHTSFLRIIYILFFSIKMNK